MSFTDEDLKRLKELLAKTIEPNSDDARDFCRLAVDNCSTIIARLEAAEKCAEWIKHVGLDSVADMHHEYYEAWRKECGK